MRLLYLFAGYLIIALAIFYPSMHGGFIMDDWGYITLSPHITDTPTPLHFWTSFSAGPDFWPLSHTFYWIFYRLFGLNPLGYHLVNVLLHSVNGFLVFMLARRYAPRLAPWAGLLFLVHPLHVQAVSWIIQFKTLLSTALALGSVLLYLRGELAVSAGVFALSLLAKSSSVFLPFALLALETGDWKARLKKLSPFFALALLGGATTLWSNYLNFDELDADVFHMRWYQRPLLAIQSLMFYLYAFVWPQPLAYVYPYLVPDSYAWTLGFSAIFIAVAGLALERIPLFNGCRRLALAYLIVLIPCLGFVAIPNMKLSLVADHWAYFPDVFLVIFAMASIDRNIPWLVPAHVLAFLPVIPLGQMAFDHAKTFATEETFWKSSREMNPESPVSYYNLGTTYDKQKKYKEALDQYALAVQKEPLHARAWYNMGRDHFLLGNPAGAREGFGKAIELNPKLIVGYISLSKVHMALLNKEKAIEVVKKGLAANPDDPELVKWIAELEKEEP